MTPSTRDSIEIERVFDAPRALVFANWVDAEHLGSWFAPAGFDVIDCAVDQRPGGFWRVAYQSSAGELYTEHGQFLEIAAPEHLVFTLINENERGEVMLRSQVRVDFREQNGKTTMSFVQGGFTSTQHRNMMQQGWSTCLDKLDRQLVAQREVRALFESWFQASQRKDLDASMTPIAKHVLSYEHEAPLTYRGVDALRATCKAGFEAMPDGFRWEVPDLRVIVRGDLAITWGLNRMHGPGVEMWSRGTRIFQKIDRRWQLIHQHVSFPFDPGSGAAKLDLKP